MDIKSGHKVYYDSFGGMIKAVYLSSNDNGSVVIKITSRNNRLYKSGEIVSCDKIHVIPRDCYHKTGIFTYRVYPDNYHFV